MSNSETDIPIKLWKIDDGEVHHVAAHSVEEALPFVAAMCDMPVDEYVKEHEPSIDFADYTKPLRVNMTGEMSLPDGFPNGCQIIVEIPVSMFDEMPTGLISSTVY